MYVECSTAVMNVKGGNEQHKEASLVNQGGMMSYEYEYDKFGMVREMVWILMNMNVDDFIKQWMRARLQERVPQRDHQISGSVE